MTETAEENRKRLEYEIGAKIRPNGNFQWGFSFWPNNMYAVSFFDSNANIINSLGHKIARFKSKKLEIK